MRTSPEIKAELERIAGEHGGTITAELVLDAARSKKSVLHDAGFEWNDGKAAEAHRLGQARTLLIICRLEVTRETRTFTIPKFTRDPLVRSDTQGYVEMEVARNDEDRAKLIVRREFTAAYAHLARARNVAQYLGLEDEIDGIMGSIDRLNTKPLDDAPEQPGYGA